jgi:hypothetical protein
VKVVQLGLGRTSNWIVSHGGHVLGPDGWFLTEEVDNLNEVFDIYWLLVTMGINDGIQFDGYQETHWIGENGYYWEARQPVSVRVTRWSWQDGELPTTPVDVLVEGINALQPKRTRIEPTGPITVRGVPIEPNMRTLPDLWPHAGSAYVALDVIDAGEVSAG